jgi:1,4-dihydroxy-2-naphthoate octaprenyltransferase
MIAGAYITIVPITIELSPWVLLPFLTLPLAIPLVRTVQTRTDGASLNGALADTGRLLALFSLLLAVGVLVS